MPKAFISYRRTDSAALATLIAVTLNNEYAVDTFVDTRNTDGGGPFPDRLRRAIEASDVFICLLGATTLDSTWVLTEIQHAARHQKTMIPVFQERYASPEPVPNAEVAQLLQSDGIQILDVRNIYVDEAIEQLAKMISKSVPRKLRLGRASFAILTFVILLAAGLFVFAQNAARGTTPNTPSTPLVVTTASSSAEQGYTRVTHNSDWSIIRQDFDGVTMVLVPAGCFDMGSEDGPDNERPVVELCFSEPFWIDKFEVTNGQFATFDGRAEQDSHASDENQPRDSVTWHEARAFCLTRGARLPTEPEWEYAAGGPDNLRFPWGDEWSGDKVVWYDNSPGESLSVGSYPESVSWVGAHDMSGNVWEWVNSRYLEYPYDHENGPESAIDQGEDYRVIRGGAYDSEDEVYLTTSFRNNNVPEYHNIYDGFRCARDY